MGHSSGELSDGLDFLRLTQFLFDFSPLGYFPAQFACAIGYLTFEQLGCPLPCIEQGAHLILPVGARTAAWTALERVIGCTGRSRKETLRRVSASLLRQEVTPGCSCWLVRMMNGRSDHAGCSDTQENKSAKSLPKS